MTLPWFEVCFNLTEHLVFYIAYGAHRLGFFDAYEDTIDFCLYHLVGPREVYIISDKRAAMGLFVNELASLIETDKYGGKLKAETVIGKAEDLYLKLQNADATSEANASTYFAIKKDIFDLMSAMQQAGYEKPCIAYHTYQPSDEKYLSTPYRTDILKFAHTGEWEPLLRDKVK